jgi:hypothetical protein
MTDIEIQFHESLKLSACPPQFSVFLKVLWYDGRGDWHTAHDLVNDLATPNAAWLHAYLHRKEGDLSNADYWYKRASRQRPKQSLQDEWQVLVTSFCSNVAH